MAETVGRAGEQPQRRAHERMTPEQFVWWLRGYLDSFSELTNLPRADVQALRDRLESVGPVPYVPPAPPQAGNSLSDALKRHAEQAERDAKNRATQSRCPRCHTYVNGAHFCNGVLVQ